MKKREQRLSLHRETLLQLGKQELAPQALQKVNAGIADVSSCIQPRCLGSDPV